MNGTESVSADILGWENRAVLNVTVVQHPGMLTMGLAVSMMKSLYSCYILSTLKKVAVIYREVTFSVEYTVDPFWNSITVLTQYCSTHHHSSHLPHDRLMSEVGMTFISQILFLTLKYLSTDRLVVSS